MNQKTVIIQPSFYQIKECDYESFTNQLYKNSITIFNKDYSMTNNLKITVLGTGTSVGIPALGKLGWGKCDPSNPKNKRQRCSLLVQNNDTNILIDAGPDIKNQLIEHNIQKLDAVFITHQHSDHISGLDELRPFYFYNNEKIKIYTNKETSLFLLERFNYLFDKSPSSQSYFKPPLEMHLIDYFDEIFINNIFIKTIKQNHGAIDTLGFVFNNNFAYCTDVVTFPKKSFDNLLNLKVLIITGLRKPLIWLTPILICLLNGLLILNQK